MKNLNLLLDGVSFLTNSGKIPISLFTHLKFTFTRYANTWDGTAVRYCCAHEGFAKNLNEAGVFKKKSGSISRNFLGLTKLPGSRFKKPLRLTCVDRLGSSKCFFDIETTGFLIQRNFIPRFDVSATI